MEEKYMVFVEPTWIDGTLFYTFWVIILPLIIGIIAGLGIWKLTDERFAGLFTLIIILIVGAPAMYGVASIMWHDQYEVPSIQEKIITVKEWQPTPGDHSNSDGMFQISNADELMLITTGDEGFFNKENFLFGKFNTRDILFALKPGGTYKIKYYGWREGYNSGFPNILSVEEIINESNATKKGYNDYFGVKLATS
jgi:hypothetical protein